MESLWTWRNIMTKHDLKLVWLRLLIIVCFGLLNILHLCLPTPNSGYRFLNIERTGKLVPRKLNKPAFLIGVEPKIWGPKRSHEGHSVKRVVSFQLLSETCQIITTPWFWGLLGKNEASSLATQKNCSTLCLTQNTEFFCTCMVKHISRWDLFWANCNDS